MTSCHVSSVSCAEPPRILTSSKLLWKVSKEEMLVKLSTLYLPMTFKLFGWLCCKTSLFLPHCKRWRRKITDEVSALCRQPSVRVWDNHNEVPFSPQSVYQPWPPVPTISTSTTYKYPASTCPRPGSMCHLSALNLILSWFIQIYIRTPTFLYTNKK